jgi:hypothetical protein
VRELWVVTDYTGPQVGTKDQPFAIAPADFDAFMHGITANPEPWTLNAPSHYLTRGAREWGPLAGADWRIPSGCVIDLQGSGVLELDYATIPDDYVQSIPWHLICSAEGWGAGLAPEEAWKAVPRGETVRNGKLIGNHSKLADRWKAAGQSLLISGAILQGHAVAIENIALEDFGSLGGEAFPLIISGAMAGPDRDALALLDPATHLFDDPALALPRTHITGCSFDKFQSALTNNQVTVYLITGAMCNDTIAHPWAEVGGWHQLYRINPIISDCTGYVRDGSPGINQCQLATIYECRGGEITRCLSRGFQAGVYGDFYSTVGLDVHHNDFEALRPVAFLTSPTGPGFEQFSHDDPIVRSNWLRCIPTDEGWHGGVLLLKLADGPTRHIRNVTVDDNDIVMSGVARGGNYAVHAQGVDGLTVKPTNRIVGFSQPYLIAPDCTGVVLPPAPATKSGCTPFGFLHL